ncbi:MAG TPA: hypothetical protein VGF29_01300 [Hyphomicrobiaceae bacterium]|jgi:hypothetical protein
MRIVTREQFPGQWTAVDDATYDGPGCPIGAGRTPAEATADLMEQLGEEPPREPSDGEAHTWGSAMPRRTRLRNG